MKKADETVHQFQNDLYKGVPQYVPTMMMDELANLDPKKNPAFEYCDMRFFLAEKDGQTVGRIGGIINKASNKKWGEKRIRITRMDFIEDRDVFYALLGAVESWAREEGLEEVVGPVGFCDLDKEGMLIEGFERAGMFITYYNHPYYKTFMEEAGFEKEVDWLEHIIYAECPDRERMQRFSDRILKKTECRELELKSKKDLKPYIHGVFELLNETYKDLFGVVPLTEPQMQYYTSQFLTLINLRYVSLIVDKENKLVAVGVNAPSLAEPMKKSGGRLFPFGFISLLKALKAPKVLDMYLVGVRQEYRGAGLNLVMMNQVLNRALEDGVVYAETGPQLESNYNIQKMWDYFKTEMNIKKRRCWKKSVN